MRIVHKLSLSFVLILLTLSTLIGIVFWNSLSDLLINELESTGHGFAANLAELSQEGIQTGNLYALYELAYLVKNKNSEIRYVLIMDTHGKLMVHTFTGGIPIKLMDAHPVPGIRPADMEISVIRSNEGKIHDILYPIEQGELGFIRIGMHEQGIKKTLFANIGKVIWIVFSLGLMTLLMTVYLTDHFTRPLLRLTKISEAISKGDLSEEAPVTSSDEIGKLSHAINSMTRSLRKHEQEEQYLRYNLINVQESERKRISRELHDESGQALTALILSMRAMANQTDDPEYRNQLLAIRDQTAEVLGQLRHLAVDLRPPVLEDMGLFAAMQKYIDDFSSRSDIHIEFIHNQEKDHGARNKEIDLALYRILQEGLTNVIKHAKAGNAQVIFTEGEKTELVIKDNGIGLPDDLYLKMSGKEHLGLHGIQERVDILHGELSIFAEPPTWSTVIWIVLPCQKEKEDV